MFVHGVNVLISNLTSYESAGNACTYYFLNILLDTTLGELPCIHKLECGRDARLHSEGVGLIYAVLHGSTWVLSKKLGIKGLKSGQYGNPPSVMYWVRQAAVYIFALATMKLLVLALFAFWPGIYAVGDWLLGWTTLFEGESVQVILYVDSFRSLRTTSRTFYSVMGVFPMIMNVVQFWLIDSIVKASTSPIAIRSTTPRNSDSQDRQPLFSSNDDDDDVPPQDIEDGPRLSTSRVTPEGDSKILVGTEDNAAKLSVSGLSSPMTLPRISVVVAHDYPPNNVGSVSSQGSTRSRHGYRRASSSLLDFSTPQFSPGVNTLNSSCQPLLSASLDGGQASTGEVAEFDVWEKGASGERVGGEGRRTEQSKILISAR